MTEYAAVANIYIEIMNNPKLMHRMFRGLFASARIYLGHKPNCHQYIFNTKLLLHYNYPAQKVDAFEKEGAIVIPFAGKESKDHLVLSCQDMRDPDANSFYQDCLESLARKDFTGQKIEEIKHAFNHIKFMKMISGMFWLDMVIFAKNNLEYTKDWRD